ncbi:plasmid mobilization protein [Hymenobacter sp. BT491]|uniref:plasmid mobilization protein n=1 Tax=Hymenobacter sp. BT491 TaxID=2766779 RepID=UPI0016538748|nr:plasmid mobilization relaxosome protein MobC [Hymenobacter sp. BT491]MBC6992509.1 plasmid mobilization relaxosome protein MobC [Hymenobacter sp. BT491]
MEVEALPELAPEGNDQSQKDQHINIRISSTDKKLVEEKAAEAGLRTGEYMRRAALGRKITGKIPPDFRRLLAATGSNLNQLTRLANAGKLSGASTQTLNELLARLLETLR